jgi:hypothetical protein
MLTVAMHHVQIPPVAREHVPIQTVAAKGMQHVQIPPVVPSPANMQTVVVKQETSVPI